jgi:predicted TIM-barrel fold metal-dependent hydrolase
MTTKPERIVDAHVHLWDPARTDWYPYLTGLRELDMGDISGWARYFDQAIYFSESAEWNVQKFVHVAAATDFVAETLEKDEEAQRTGHPDAIIGGVDGNEPVAVAVEQLDKQLASTRFRGVRPMGSVLEGAVLNADILGALQERGLVFDLMAHADELEGATKALADWGDLTIVLEHTGWPRSNSDDEFKMWKAGISSLASLSPNIHCKLSGLAMPLGTTDAEVFKPWIAHALEEFGVDRCFFASNFPPDSGHSTFDQLYTTYATLTADLDGADREKLFASNAERVYRC